MPRRLPGVLYCRRRSPRTLYPYRLTVNRTYLLISPGRNEARYMRNTLVNVAAQATHPVLRAIVEEVLRERSAAP